jgi:hypothetical protein
MHLKQPKLMNVTTLEGSLCAPKDLQGFFSNKWDVELPTNCQNLQVKNG